MRESAVAFLCGLLFALGLGVSGMTQPAKVTAFLDVAGHWDASLLFVMFGAIAVYAAGYRWAMKRSKPLWAEVFRVPAVRSVDKRLVLGSAIFGIGWGLVGYCPGPALTSLVSFRLEPALFVLSMMAGMALFEWSERKKVRPQ